MNKPDRFLNLSGLYVDYYTLHFSQKYLWEVCLKYRNLNV